MRKSIAKKAKILSAVVMAVGMLFTNTGCTASVGDLVDVVTSGGNRTEEVTVKSVNKLIEAIESNAEITLKEGDYEFAKELKDLYGTDGNEFNKSHKNVKIEVVEDGYQLIIVNAKNLTIEGKKNDDVYLSNSSAFASVLKFENCENIVIKNINIYHSRPKDKANGDVLSFKDCDKVAVSDVYVYDADGYGIAINNVTEFSLIDSEIYGCKTGAVSATKCSTLTINQCKISGCEGNLFKVTSSEVNIADSQFIDNGIDKGFINESANNNIVFDSCIFGETESADLNYGTLEGDEGYSFTDCDFAEAQTGVAVQNPGGSGAGAGGSGSNYEEYYVTDLDGFFDSIGSNRTIIMAPGEYNITEYFDSVRNTDRWSETHDNVDVWAGYGYGNYSVEFLDCENLTIRGESPLTEDHVIIKTASSSGVSDNIEFFECNNLSLYNLEFASYPTYDDSNSFVSFYYCNGGDINCVKMYVATGTAFAPFCCEGTWYVYDSEFSGGEGFGMNLDYTEGTWYFDGCCFDGSDKGVFINDIDWYMKEVSFSNCFFGYNEWMMVCDDDSIELINCECGEITDQYMLIEYENLIEATMDEDVLCDCWYAYLYVCDGEVCEVPANKAVEIDFFDDYTGYIYGLIDEDVFFTWYDDSYYSDLSKVYIYISSGYEIEEGYVEGKIYGTEDDKARMHICLDGTYYLFR